MTIHGVGRWHTSIVVPVAQERAVDPFAPSYNELRFELDKGTLTIDDFNKLCQRYGYGLDQLEVSYSDREGLKKLVADGYISPEEMDRLLVRNGYEKL